MTKEQFMQCVALNMGVAGVPFYEALYLVNHSTLPHLWDTDLEMVEHYSCSYWAEQVLKEQG